MIKVLATVSQQYLNPYPREVYEELVKHNHIECTYSSQKFWLPDIYDFDIIHIHWPELVITLLVNSDFIIDGNNFKSEIYTLGEVLKKWKAKSKIVITCHNERPHYKNDEFTDLLYDLMYEYADAFIHLGNYSLNNFMENEKLSIKKNFLIPHSVYCSYENTSNKIESRKRYNIPQDALVVLVFSTRNKNEIDFATRTFELIEAKNKFLFSPKWFIEDFSKSGYLMGKIKEKLFSLKMKFKKNQLLMSNRNLLKEEDIQYYVHASDLFLIPRIDTLNSGVIPLAIAFKKPVIGPKTGNITEVMETIQNPIFEKNDFKEAAKLINKLVHDNKLVEIGEFNYKKGEELWSVPIIAEKHLNAYREIIGII